MLPYLEILRKILRFFLKKSGVNRKSKYFSGFWLFFSDFLPIINNFFWKVNVLQFFAILYFRGFFSQKKPDFAVFVKTVTDLEKFLRSHRDRKRYFGAYKTSLKSKQIRM